MSISKPQITNDIHSPCNKNKCSLETINSCCGCPEWFAWKTGADQWKMENEYLRNRFVPGGTR